MVTHTEYNNIGSMFGLGRAILWLIVLILQWITSIMENIYNHIFALFGVIYSDSVVNFIKSWIGFLWIPIAISLVVLGYNLIMGDASDGSVRLKSFGRNLCLLLLILVGLPYLFVGSGAFGSTDAELSELFAEDRGNAIVSGVSNMAGVSSNTTHTQKTIIESIYDLKSIFNQAAADGGGFTSNWSDKITNGSICRNDFYADANTIVNAPAVLSINPFECIRSDDVDDDDEYSSDLTAEDIAVDGYDYCGFFSDTNKKISFDPLIKHASIPSYDNVPNASQSGTITNSNIPDAKLDIEAKQFLFQTIHSYYRMDINDDEDIDFVLVNNGGKTKTDNWIMPDIGNTFPFRYHIEWGRLILRLIISIAVLFLTSLKIAKIMYEITVNQLLALFFGAIDLSNGQRVKEILKSIFSLAASAFFAVIMVEFFYLITDEIGNITFVSDATTNGWIQTIAILFIGIATIKGPSVLEKVLGVGGGLSDEWRDMAAVNRTARPLKFAALGAAYKGTQLAGKGIKAAAGVTAFGASKIAGKVSASKAEKEARKGNAKDSIHGNGQARSEQAGDARQFSAARNEAQVKRESGPNAATADTKDFSTNWDATKTDAANKSMAGQGRDINDVLTMQAGNDLEKRQQVADEYKGNIQNAALAERAKNGEGRKEELTESYMDKGFSKEEASNLADRDVSKEALTKAYEGSGFSKEEALNLANRDMSDGSFAERQEKFDNSISESAKQKLTDAPLSYDNKMEAYKEAAEEHYNALGFSGADNADLREQLSSEAANRICLEDNQAMIREDAQNIMRNNPSVVDEKDAVRQAVQGASKSLGYNPSRGNYDDAAQVILNSGSLKEGVVRGRTFGNETRVERNTRAGNLGNARENNIFSPTADAMTEIAMGYYGARSFRNIVNKGFESGKKSHEYSQAHKDYKQMHKTKNVKVGHTKEVQPFEKYVPELMRNQNDKDNRKK